MSPRHLITAHDSPGTANGPHNEAVKTPSAGPQDLPPEGGQDTGSTGHGTLMAAAVKP